MEIFVESAKLIDIVFVQFVPQPVDTNVVTKMVRHGQKIIVDTSFPFPGQVISCVPDTISIVK
jgi:hypothetical protein